MLLDQVVAIKWVPLAWGAGGGGGGGVWGGGWASGRGSGGGFGGEEGMTRRTRAPVREVGGGRISGHMALMWMVETKSR